MYGKTNAEGIKDTNLTAGNIKYGVSISGVMGTFPNDGTATSDKVANGYTFYVSGPTKYTGSYVPPSPLGSIYIASYNFNYNMGASSGGYGGGSDLYSVNVGNYIYSFSWGYAGGWKLLVLYFTTNSSVFPVRDYVSLPYTIFPGYIMDSQYLDSGVVYFNGHQNGGSSYYDTFNTSTHAWTTGNAGSHTSGTLINSALQLNGFQYDSKGLWKSDSGTLWADIQTKVTKL